MAKLRCNCGHVTNFSVDNENALILFSREELVDILANIIDRSLSDEEIENKLFYDAIDVYRCEKCKRLYIQEEDENGDHVATYIYELEEIDQPANDEESEEVEGQ